MPVLDVCHSGAGPSAFVAVQPAGSAGGATPSKFSLNVVVGSAQEALPASSASVLAVELVVPDPPAATSVVPIAVPPTSVRASFRLGPLAQVFVTGS